MDLSNIQPSERVIEIVHPGNKSQILGVRVCVLSINDERMKKLKRRIQDERLRLETKGKSFKSEDIDENRSTLAFHAMTSWEWYNPTGKAGDEGYDETADAKFDGGKPDFNQKNVLEVFTKLPWFREQIEEAVGDEESFFQTSK